MLYNDSDRDRESDLRTVRDVVGATASRWFIAMNIQLGSLICQVTVIKTVLWCFNLHGGQIHSCSGRRLC